jgi:hypothetical protein
MNGGVMIVLPISTIDNTDQFRVNSVVDSVVNSVNWY